MFHVGNVEYLIERTDSPWVPFEILEWEESCEFGYEDFPFDDERFCLAANGGGLPDEFLEMEPGDRLWIKAEMHYGSERDYWGEWDSEIELEKVRVYPRQLRWMEHFRSEFLARFETFIRRLFPQGTQFPFAFPE